MYHGKKGRNPNSFESLTAFEGGMKREHRIVYLIGVIACSVRTTAALYFEGWDGSRAYPLSRPTLQSTALVRLGRRLFPNCEPAFVRLRHKVLTALPLAHS